MGNTSNSGAAGVTDNADNAASLGNAGDILFENRYEYTAALLRKWNHSLSFKRSARYNLWALLATVIVCAVTALFFALNAVLTGDSDLFGLSVLAATASLIIAWFPRQLNRMLYNNFAQQQLQPQTQFFRSLRFGYKIEVACANTTVTFLYAQVAFIEENDDCFCLWINGKAFLPIYKNAFETGDAESFRTFIVEKCTESHPLLTKKQFNRPHFRRILPLIILMAVVLSLLLLYCLSATLLLLIQY